MRTSEEVVLYLKKLHSIVRYLDISDANMQEGSFRCDVNVSIRPKGDEKLYTRVEIKNLNSFKFIEKAIAVEVERQTIAWEDGVYDDEILQETRLYDQDKQETRSMRGKEGAADYRYFPEPDLLPVKIDDAMLEKYSKIPELPNEKRDRFISEYKLSTYNANVITASLEMADFFEDMLKEGGTPKTATTWLTVELLARLKGGLSLSTSPANSKTMGQLVNRIDDQTISGKAAKEVLDYLMENDSDVDSAIDKLNLKQVTDTGAIEAMCDEVIGANEDEAEQYRGGKDKLIGFFVGQVMKASNGSANPQVVNEILKAKLG